MYRNAPVRNGGLAALLVMSLGVPALIAMPAMAAETLRFFPPDGFTSSMSAKAIRSACRNMCATAKRWTAGRMR